MPEKLNKIKIVQVIADSDLSGGPKHVLGLLDNLDKDKFDCFLICPAGQLSVEAGKIPKVEVINVVMKSKFDIISMFEIHGVLEKIRASEDPFGPMIIHLHGTRAGLLGGFAVKRNMPIVYTEHRYDADYHLKNPINEVLQKTILKMLFKRSKSIIAVSSSVRDFLIRSGIVAKEKVHIIPNGIDLGIGKEGLGTKKIKEGNKAPIIGTVGNLNVQKGQRYLIQAMLVILEHYPLATLEIIGKGPLREDLESLIQDLKIESRVTLLGMKKDVFVHLKHWDVFVLPSIAETFGIVLLEAMQAGVPVVASKVGGILDIIDHKSEGILVPPRNPAEIAEAVQEILDHPALAAKLKKAGKDRVKDFDWKKVIKEIEELYLSLAS